MNTCPVCGCDIKITVIQIEPCQESKEADRTTLRVDLYRGDTDLNLLWECFVDYLRWCVLGKPKYKDEQFFYDDYHNHIELFEKDAENVALNEEIYRFNIRIYDSSERDTWWSGSFRVNDYELEILKSKTKKTSH